MISLRTSARSKTTKWLTKLVRYASGLLLSGGLAAVGYALSILAIGRTYQALELRDSALAAPTAEPHVPVIGETLGQIQIPSVGLNAIILQGDSSQVLRRGVGHLPNTAMPGELGNIGLAGHRDTFFRPLRHIRVGDVIILHGRAGKFQYQVESIRVVSPQDTQVLQSSNRNELTLVTCFPFEYIGAAPNRFIVHAHLLEPSED